MGERLELVIGVLNGTIGDYLARRGNGLATETTLVVDGREVSPTSSDLARAYPDARSKVVVLVHGLMNTESVWKGEDGSDYGSCLARDLGFTPLYVRYNSGRPIPESGKSLAELLARVVDAFPVRIDDLLLIGFSMGGLVVRAACHEASIAKSAWLERVHRAIYVGTPHRGAPLERAGRLATKLLASIPDPYTRLVADIANLRSDGLKDLGDADLRHEDRARRSSSLGLRDPRHPVPLLPSIRHHLIAGTLSSDPTLARVVGDALVPVPSGLAEGAHDDLVAPEHVKIFPGFAHLTLAHHPDVYAQIRAFCEAA